jgi:hypothetical protein
MQFLAILMAEWGECQEGRPSFRAENRQQELQTCETLRRQPDFSHRKGYMGTVASRV